MSLEDRLDQALTPSKKEKPLRRICDIAMDISEEWRSTKTGIYFGAVPHLKAMFFLEDKDSVYGCDTAVEVISYFMANAKGFRGERARELKLELEAHLPPEYRRKARRTR